jgi:hypothetical protein
LLAFFDARTPAILVISFFIVVIGWPIAFGASPPSAKPPRITCALDKENGMTEEVERTCLALAGNLAVRNGNTISLSLDNGQKKFFINTPCDNKPGACRSFFFFGFNDTINRYVVLENWADASYNHFVSKTDGKTVELREPVYFSPSGKQVVSIPANELIDSSYDIKIYDFENGKAELKFLFYNQDDWEFVSWEKSGLIKVRVVEANSPNHPYTASLQMVDDRWRLIEDTPSKKD